MRQFLVQVPWYYFRFATTSDTRQRSDILHSFHVWDRPYLFISGYELQTLSTMIQQVHSKECRCRINFCLVFCEHLAELVNLT